MAENNYTQLEAQWAIYFDKVGIDYIYQPKTYRLLDGKKILPTYYLPDFQCFALVSEGVLEKKDYFCAKRLVIETQIPLIVLDDQPDLRFYSMIAPLEIGTEVQKVNIVSHPERDGELLVWDCLWGETMYERAGLEYVIEAVEATHLEGFSY